MFSLTNYLFLTFWLLAAVLVPLIYKLYTLFLVPTELKSIPEISLLKTLISLIKREDYQTYFENTLKPALAKKDVVRIWRLGQWELILSDAQLIREILFKEGNFLKRRAGDDYLNVLLLRKTLGYSNLLMADGSDWRRHRRVANPAFKASFSPVTFGDCTKDLISLIESSQGKPLQMLDLFKRLTLDALGKGLFSYEFGAVAEKGNPVLELYDDVTKAMFNPIYLIFPFLEDWIPSRKVYHQKSQEFRCFLKNIILERVTNVNEENKDLLSLMIKAMTIDKNIEFTEEDVINDLVVFFFAGHDTTASTLSIILFYLAKHQDIQERARNEVNTIIDEVRIPTAEELKRLQYIDCIIYESMRIVTLVVQLRRYCCESQTLSDGTLIPEDTFVSLDMWRLHHDLETYPNPYLFNPDRFLQPQSLHLNQWIAFGKGARMCIGKNFAMMEMRVAVSLLLQSFNFQPGPIGQTINSPKIDSFGLLSPYGLDLIFNPIE
ncbi:hypothetical protein DSO57_1027774 [Entomophthora muscae]|uniref:Uncharacterized protein n=1 Tax=Entomophthora muscae TaxID=34485 RepID=A0ACC2TPV9_9FUNG|nr:hypothetical protein DSO57_1027774 [Entomophthora muscae]